MTDLDLSHSHNDDSIDRVGHRYRVVLVEDEDFTRGLLAQALRGAGVDVRDFATAAQALRELEACDPHVVMTDLDLGPGPSGVHLLRGVAQNAPWVGRVMLSVHASPQLGARDGSQLPDDVVYLVKSAVTSPEDLLAAIEAAIEHRGVRGMTSDGDRVVISAAHGEVLLLVAEGLSNAGIAEVRGTTVNAAEGMVQRLFLALGLRSDGRYNPRVLAVSMWRQGRVIVR